MEIKNAIKISAPISPYDSDDTYPSHLAIYGKGGMRSVQTMEERNNIPEARREEGMFVYVIEEQKVFQLIGGIENSNWNESEALSGKVSSLFVSESQPDDPTPNSIWIDPNTNYLYYRDPENTQWNLLETMIDGGEF